MDSLLESGDLSEDDIPYFNITTAARSVEDVIQDVSTMAVESNSLNLTSSALLTPNFPGDKLSVSGEKVLEAIEKRAQRHDQKQFKHFALDLTVTILIPRIVCHYYSRSGQIEQRTAKYVIWPALFCTGKKKLP